MKEAKKKSQYEARKKTISKHHKRSHQKLSFDGFGQSGIAHIAAYGLRRPPILILHLNHAANEHLIATIQSVRYDVMFVFGFVWFTCDRWHELCTWRM